MLFKDEPKVIHVRDEVMFPSGSCIYVGRPTKYGNPFRVGVDGTKIEVIDKFRKWLFSNPELMKDARRELKGKNLVCWCAPAMCHAQVLLYVANEYEET